MSFNVEAYADEHDVEVYVIEPRTIYDSCIIRVDVVGDQHIVVYDFEATVSACMKENGWERSDAAEWILFNDGMILFDDEDMEDE